MKVGFVGLGDQGAPIARRIARSGFDLVACDISAQALAAFDEPGVSPIRTPSRVTSSVATISRSTSCRVRRIVRISPARAM